MLDYRLDKQELAELRAAHRGALNVREAYRINAVIFEAAPVFCGHGLGDNPSLKIGA